MTVINSTDARARFAEIMKEAESNVVQITQRNRPAAALISWDAYESLIETLEIVSDPEIMASIRRSEEQVAKGETVDWDEFKKTYLA